MEGAQQMANEMIRTAKFIGKDTKLGREIMAEPRYARYRAWLGKEIRVDLSTAELQPNSATETKVRITIMNTTRDTEMVRSAHITGLTHADLEVMLGIAYDRQFPTRRVGSATTREEVAPPA